MWTGALLLTILIVKVPFVIADTIIKDKPISPGTMLERVLLAQTNEESVPVAACSVE
jgi:hypothetical protein